MSIKKTTVTLATALSLAAVPMASLAHDGNHGRGDDHRHRGQSAEFHQDKGKSAQHFRGAQNRVDEDNDNDGQKHVVFPQPPASNDTATTTPTTGDTTAATDTSTPVATTASADTTTQPAPVVKASIKGTDQNNDKFKFSFAGTLEQFGSFLQSVAQFLGFSNGSDTTS